MVDIPINLWIPALTKPKETFSKAKKSKVSLVDALIIMALCGAIEGLVVGLFTGAGLIWGLIIGLVAALLFSFVGTGLFWLMAKLLGGKGEFTRQYYLYSLFGAPIAIASILGILPVIGQVISILLSLYSLYPLTISIREIHGFDTLKAVLSWLVPGIILLVIAVIMILVAGYGANGFGY